MVGEGGEIMIENLEAVFIDRDGTIGGDGHFIHPKDFKPYPFALEALKLLKDDGVKIFSFTNQHRISEGQATIEEFEEEFLSFGFDKTYICPHAMDGNCDCHKPEPGMLLKAAEENELNLKNCLVIGDLGSDMVAADIVGAKKILVKTGWGQGSIGEYRHLWKDVNTDYIAENLLDAVNWIITE